MKKFSKLNITTNGGSFFNLFFCLQTDPYPFSYNILSLDIFNHKIWSNKKDSKFVERSQRLINFYNKYNIHNV